MAWLFLTMSPAELPWDAAEGWQLGFQDAATPMMQGIIDLHHDLKCFCFSLSLCFLVSSCRTLWKWRLYWHCGSLFVCLLLFFSVIFLGLALQANPSIVYCEGGNAFSLSGRAISLFLLKLGCSAGLSLAIGFAVKALLTSGVKPNMPMLPIFSFILFLCKKVVLGFLCPELEEIISSFLETFYHSVGNDGTSSSSSRKPSLDLNSSTAAENSYFLEELTRVEELSRKIDCGESLSKEELEELICRLDRLEKNVIEGQRQLFQESWNRYPEKIREQIDLEKKVKPFRESFLCSNRIDEKS